MPGNVDDVGVVEVQPRDCVVALGSCGLLLDRGHPAVVVERHDAVFGGIGDLIGEDMPTVDRREGAQLGAKAGAVEDVVPQHQRGASAIEEVRSQQEGLSQALRPWLDHVLERHPQVRAIAEEALERVLILGGGDDEDLTKPGGHQGPEGVVDHRLVEDRQQLLADATGDRPQPRTGAPGEDDPFHAVSVSTGTRASAGTAQAVRIGAASW